MDVQRLFDGIVTIVAFDIAKIIGEEMPPGTPVEVQSVGVDVKIQRQPRRRRGSQGIKNPATYRALKRKGFTSKEAAKISNAALKKGHKLGVHRPRRGGKIRRPSIRGRRRR